MDEDKLKKELGSNIKNKRTALNLTQEEFSEKIGITQRQISLIELGKSFPSPKTLVNITQILNCHLSDLFTFKSVENIENIKKELVNSINNLEENKLKILYSVYKNI